TGAFGRRVMAAPVGDCGGFANGKSTVTVNGFICVFLLQALTGGGKDPIFGQVIGQCEAKGRPGAGSSVTGPHIIELYKSAGSPDS
ncbi:MAG: pilus assembly protein, partial [Steroidobacteraceae bacterium]